MRFFLAFSIYFCYNIFTNFKEALKCALEKVITSIVADSHPKAGIIITENVAPGVLIMRVDANNKVYGVSKPNPHRKADI